MSTLFDFVFMAYNLRSEARVYVLVFLGIFYTGKIRTNNWYRDAQGGETNTLVFLVCFYMAWNSF